MPRYKATSEGNIPFTAAEEEAADKRDADWLLGADDRAAEANRSTRDAKLAETDWMTMRSADTSTPVPSAWHTYRQALRDITSHSNWPNLYEADWPTEPS